MLNDAIDLVTIQSEAGHGKTFLALAAALYLTLERKLYDKIFVVKPTIEIGRIIEINLEYGWKASELKKMKSTMFEKIDQIVQDSSNLKAAMLALKLYEQLAQTCEYDPTGSIQSGKEEA